MRKFLGLGSIFTRVLKSLSAYHTIHCAKNSDRHMDEGQFGPKVVLLSFLFLLLFELQMKNGKWICLKNSVVFSTFLISLGSSSISFVICKGPVLLQRGKHLVALQLSFDGFCLEKDYTLNCNR